MLVRATPISVFGGFMTFRRSAAALCAATMALSLSACAGSSVHATAQSPNNAGHFPAGSIQALVNQKVKHVFVIVQENHTFDNYFGLYPGPNGQTVENLASATAQADDCVPDPEAGAGACQRPFLITTNKSSPNYVLDAPDINAGSNSRFGQQYAIDGGKMDRFLIENESSNPLTTAPTPLPAQPTMAQVDAHVNTLNIMAAYDCDTIPYLWYYAKNFTLFDHYFQANTGQSTPGNVQLFAGQIGQTQVAAGKATTLSTLSGTGYTDGLPLGDDSNPPDTTLSFRESFAAQATPDQNQFISVASLPVMLNPGEDAAAVKAGVTGKIPDDMALEAKATHASIPWAWYEEGLLYPSDGTAKGTWSQHHTAPLYFDYINNANSQFGNAATLRDNTYSNGLLSDIQTGALPSEGVFWVKGGATASSFPFKPADATLAAGGYFTGDDDHPGSGSADHQVAEAYVATMINAIANSKYWKDSVIILTWDDSGGMYDHYPPTEYGGVCPDDKTGTFAGMPCGDGLRLPMLVISPFAKNGAVVHDQSDAGSVSKFIETVFGLPTLASLPDEVAGESTGLAPADANAAISDLTGALDINKLNGSAAPIAASTAMISSPAVPPSMSCTTLGITPVASPAALPAGFLTGGAIEVYTLTGTAGNVRMPPPPNDDDD
jgi:phospholipase C